MILPPPGARARGAEAAARAESRAGEPTGAVPAGPKPRAPRVRPGLQTAGAASGRGPDRGAVLAAHLARGFAHYALLFLRAVGVQLVLAVRLIRRHAPTVGRFFAELAAFGVAAVTGLARFTTAYVRTWLRAVADWRAARRWQESRPSRRRTSGRRRRTGAARRRTNAHRSALAPRLSRVRRIEDYALLGDLQTAALLGRTARSTGAASRASTRARASPRCSARPTTGAGCSRRDAPMLHELAPLPHRHADPGDGLRDGPRAVRAIDFMPPRGQAPDIVRIVEGLDGEVGCARSS